MNLHIEMSNTRNNYVGKYARVFSYFLKKCNYNFLLTKNYKVKGTTMALKQRGL